MSELENEATKTCSTEIPWLWLVLISVIVATIVSVATLLIYHQAVAKRDALRLAVVDIGEIMDIKQLQLTQAAMARDIDDSARGKLYDDVTNFSAAVESALASMQNECKCTLVVRAAIVKGDAPDMTENLKSRLGMAGIDPIQMAKQLSALESERVKK